MSVEQIPRAGEGVVWSSNGTATVSQVDERTAPGDLGAVFVRGRLRLPKPRRADTPRHAE
jgi:hypothetical protein